MATSSKTNVIVSGHVRPASPMAYWCGTGTRMPLSTSSTCSRPGSKKMPIQSTSHETTPLSVQNETCHLTQIVDRTDLKYQTNKLITPGKHKEAKSNRRLGEREILRDWEARDWEASERLGGDRIADLSSFTRWCYRNGDEIDDDILIRDKIHCVEHKAGNPNDMMDRYQDQTPLSTPSTRYLSQMRDKERRDAVVRST